MASNQLGFVTGLGQQVFDGQQTCAGICGLVHLRGTELPAPASKLDRAVLPDGGLKIRASEAPGALISKYRLKHRGAKPKKWINLEKDDLELLKSIEVPQRWRGRAVGPLVAGAYPLISANTPYNQAKAVICRMFAGPEPPQEGIWRWAARFKRVIFEDYDYPPAEMSDPDWLDSLPPERREPLSEALELWHCSGWQAKYETFHSFIKEEFLVAFSKDGLDLLPIREMVDRLINAPHDVTHAIAGKKIKPYMAWLKTQWSPTSHIFYGGTKPVSLHQWLQRATGCGRRLVFWSDYSMFDATHNEETWAFVEDFYRQYKSDPAFQKVLQAWRAPKGTIGPFKYQGRVMNASGRDDTALANAILNGVAMLLSVTAAWYNIPLREVTHGHIIGISSDLLLSVCGDDALGFLPSCEHARSLELITQIRANLQLFGFSPKLFCSDRFEDAVYLGHRPLPYAGTWYWTRTVGRCLYKLGWQCRIRGDPRAHFHGVMKMHESCSLGVPILGDITASWLRVSKGAKVNPWKPDPNKPWEEMGKAAPKQYYSDTVAAFARAYTVSKDDLRQDLGVQDVRVTPENVMECSRYVTEQVLLAKGRPCVLDHWLLRHMVAVDEQ